MDSDSARPPATAEVSTDENATASGPRIDRYAIALNVFVLICATTSAYFAIQYNHYGFWQITSLISQVAISIMAVYRLSRVKWKRTSSE